MYAIVCDSHGGPEVMQYREVPPPKPAAAEILVKSEAIGVNFVDTMRRSGRHPAAPQPPFTPGIEVCGRVVELGEGATRFQLGDRVLGRCVSHGAYAELVAVEERFAVACPDEIPAAEGAALLVNPLTAWCALSTVGRVQRGESVLITAAAGGVGLCAVQIARLLGARPLAAAGSEAKLQLAREYGPAEAINYTLPDWPQEVIQATDGRGVDLLLESVGGDVFRGCLRCWAPGGRAVIYGKASGQPAHFSGDDLLFGNRTVQGLAVGIVIEDEAIFRAAMDQILNWHAAGDLKVLVGATFALSDAVEAHRQLVGRNTIGKVVLLP